VEAIPRAEAREVILRYEWLGTMGSASTATYGLRAPAGELLGVSVFGWNSSVQARDICGREHRELAVSLERGACVHYAPPHAASFLISRAVKLATADHGWRIFYAYADPAAGEIGTVYQACNWLYLGQGVGRSHSTGDHANRQDWLIPDAADAQLLAALHRAMPIADGDDRQSLMKNIENIEARITAEENKVIIASRTLRNRKITPHQAYYELGWIPVYRHPKHKYIHFEGDRTERKRLRAALRYPVLPYPKRQVG
jgi:hypothetical protein